MVTIHGLLSDKLRAQLFLIDPGHGYEQPDSAKRPIQQPEDTQHLWFRELYDLVVGIE